MIETLWQEHAMVVLPAAQLHAERVDARPQLVDEPLAAAGRRARAPGRGGVEGEEVRLGQPRRVKCGHGGGEGGDERQTTLALRERNMDF
jgi:hypothetical protein